MESRIYSAAIEGSVISLLKFLKEDALVLDRFIVSCYSETPLHIASMLEHVDFVQEIISRKPELAGVLDSRKSSPLHLATAKGYLDIVKILVSVNPEMCFVRDQDGRNPLHIAAIKGHVNALIDLVQVRPQAARILMNRGETILHASVYFNQLEALKFLVETISDDEFLNSKDGNGNTILHLAVIDKQVEVTKFLTTNTKIDVNALNAIGFTALDISTVKKRDVKEWEIGELLRCGGAINAKDVQLSTSGNLGNTETASNLKSDDNNQGKRPENEKQEDWLKKMRSSLMVVASLIATMAFQAGMNPPGGVWQDSSGGKVPGDPIMANSSPALYNLFIAFNTTGFMASLSIILFLISGLPFMRRTIFTWTLIIVMWIAISAMTMTYLFSVLTISTFYTSYPAPIIVLSVWIGLIVILLLGHAVSFMRKTKCFIRRNLQA